MPGTNRRRSCSRLVFWTIALAALTPKGVEHRRPWELELPRASSIEDLAARAEPEYE